MVLLSTKDRKGGTMATTVVRIVEDGPGWKLEPVRDYQSTDLLNRRFDTQAHAKAIAQGCGLVVEEKLFGMTICDVVI